MKKNARFIINRIAAAALALLIGAGVFLNVPPPRHAHADFAGAGAWAGAAGGSANALVLSVANVQSLGDLLGVPIRFNPASNNTGPATIAIQSLAGTTSAVTVLRPSSIGLVAFSLNEFWAGETTSVVYNGANFVLNSNVDMRPIGSTCEFRGTGAPRGCLIEDGSCVSSTQFAALNSVLGTGYGTCSGANVKVPDSRGTDFLAYDNQGVNGAANRITTASCAAPNSPVLCGHETHVMLLSELVAHTHANTLTDPGHSHSIGGNTGVRSITAGNGGAPFVGIQLNNGSDGSVAITSSGTGITINNVSQGGGGAMPILNPKLPGIRAIKY